LRALYTGLSGFGGGETAAGPYRLRLSHGIHVRPPCP
jgi:hypothetical protein